MVTWSAVRGARTMRHNGRLTAALIPVFESRPMHTCRPASAAVGTYGCAGYAADPLRYPQHDAPIMSIRQEAQEAWEGVNSVLVEAAPACLGDMPTRVWGDSCS